MLHRRKIVLSFMRAHKFFEMKNTICEKNLCFFGWESQRIRGVVVGVGKGGFTRSKPKSSKKNQEKKKN